MINKIKNIIKTSTMSIKINKKKINYSVWLFSSSFNEKFNYNSKYLFEYVINNEPNIQPLFVINDDKLRYDLQKKYGKRYFIETKTIKGITRALTAGVWLTSAGLPVYGFNLNKYRIIVNLWHGVPLKKIGMLDKEMGFINKLYFKLIFSQNYSYVITTSSKLKGIMADSFKVTNEKVKVLGQPRNDIIINDSNKDLALKHIFSGIPSDNKLILYAPTYRGYKETTFFPFNDFDHQKLSEYLIKHNLVIFIKPHQSELSRINNLYQDDRIKIIRDKDVSDIMQIINMFDLLITDYSSIFIDFLLTKKPILFLPYDIEEYRTKRGFNFQYEDFTPGPKPESMYDFFIEINNLLNNREYYLDERIKINHFFNEITEPCSKSIVCFINQKLDKYKN